MKTKKRLAAECLIGSGVISIISSIVSAVLYSHKHNGGLDPFSESILTAVFIPVGWAVWLTKPAGWLFIAGISALLYFKQRWILLAPCTAALWMGTHWPSYFWEVIFDT